MKLKIIAAFALAASAAFAEEEPAATTLAGARVPVSVFAPVSSRTSSGWWDYMQPFTYRGYSSTTEKGGVWVDVGSPRTLTGVMFYPRYFTVR